MLRKVYTIVLAITLLIPSIITAQTYQGPSQGSVASGAIVNTSSFADFPISNDTDPIIRGEMNLNGSSTEPLLIENDGKEVFSTTYVDDKKFDENLNGIGDNALLLKKFNVAVDNSVIPPDPTIAVGPNHVMVLTNNGVGIRIYDKQGTLLKSISSSTWWSAVWPSQEGDPQIFYDHFSNRWVMLFMQVNDVALTAGNLIAYSDDSDPLGTWYMYRLDTKMHGTTVSSTWGDYPQIGFDEQAIYIMTRCFTFAGNFSYTKIRIISKAEFYASNAGPFTYKDIWDITVPGQSTRPDVIHPSFQYSSAGVHYLLWANRSGANFYTLYKIANPVTAPVLTGVNITVPFFGAAPNANQLGGGTLIEANGSHIKTSPVFRDGFLYATHSIRNSTNINYSSIKYVKINVATNSVVESAELGANGYYYIYPAIAVDKDGSIGITCSRSADTEYIGSYFVTRRATDPAGLSPSRELQKGLGNYVITFGGTRNRWGDYLGAFIDPSDEYSFWMFSQFASGTNAYSTVVAQVRLKPFPGIYIFPETHNYNFGSVLVNTISDTIDVLVANFGADPLIINSIPASSGNFSLVSTHNFPITVGTFDSLTIRFAFQPTTAGAQSINYPVNSNSASFTSVTLNGKGYNMFPAAVKTFYATSGLQNSGQSLTINPITGAGVNLGNSNYTDILSIAVNPKTKEIYALRANAVNSELLRLNAQAGDAYLSHTFAVPNLFSIAFDSSATLYATNSTNQLYRINPNDGSYVLVANLPTQRVSISFNPLNNELWGSVKNFISNPKDRIIKINPASGDTTRIGQTGFGVNTTGLAFNETGTLYGIKGTGTAMSDFFTINKNTGVGTIVGSVGLKDLTGLAYCLDIATSVDDQNNTLLPENFSLAQNYPNPFNPSTQINFSLPINANVKLTIYNLLGETVRELLNSEMNSGFHSVLWNSDDATGKKVSSGIYFYELKANVADGKQFNQIKKMVLVK